TWHPDNGTLLDLAEGAGIDAPFSCRSGSCGTCATRIIEGTVAYATPPSAPHDDRTALICCARPTGPVTLAL
ncbi:MAG: 2Fe-2S iron-sulfur cluster-binding protein, partial [Pseudomonadota bacterium]